MNPLLASEQTGLEILYKGRGIRDIEFEDNVADKFNSNLVELGLEPIFKDGDIPYGTEYNIPPKFKELDVVSFVRSLTPPGGETRVEEELKLYEARNLFPALQMLIYIVDTCKKNNVVLGVGRGSSVASYVLYLLGVHRIDSLKYDLPITEFLK